MWAWEVLSVTGHAYRARTEGLSRRSLDLNGAGSIDRTDDTVLAWDTPLQRPPYQPIGDCSIQGA